MNPSPAWSALILPALVVALAGFGLGCVPDETEAELASRVVGRGLDGPTQLAIGPDGRWLVAQLAGGEDDGRGQVVVVDPGRPTNEPVVLVGGLDKPTGVAVFDDRLWIMEHHRLTTGPLDGTARAVVIDDLPSNGRSQGTLTVDGDRLLFNTSGRLGPDDRPVENSGILWSVSADDRITAEAGGFKHAYAHIRGRDGTLYTTEIGDGRFDGQQPPDEVVAVSPGVDHGWPRCIGDNEPVLEFGGDDAKCRQTPPSITTFAPGATPTSIVVAPWDPDTLLVALWNTGELVAIQVDDDGNSKPTVVFTGAERPQHLTVSGDKVLLTDHAAGTIIELTTQPSL